MSAPVEELLDPSDEDDSDASAPVDDPLSVSEEGPLVDELPSSPDSASVVTARVVAPIPVEDSGSAVSDTDPLPVVEEDDPSPAGSRTGSSQPPRQTASRAKENARVLPNESIAPPTPPSSGG
jgi:hypothetical protein